MNKFFQVFAGVVFSGMLMSASCNQAGAGCVEKLKADCICTMQYDPVCGCNGKTYGNACQAACASVRVEKQGECK